MEERASIFERNPRTVGIILFILLFAVLDLLVGFFFIPRDSQDFRVRHPVYHHDIEPNRSCVTNWGQIYYRFNSNSMGFRDEVVREIESVPQDYRVLLMGDSHTEAVGVEYPESFAGILSQRLEKKGIEVLNAAAVSYSPKIHYLKGKYLLEVRGMETDEIMVFIDMSDLNNEIAYEPFEPGSDGLFHGFFRRVVHRFSRHSSVVYLIDRLVSHQRTKFFKRNMAISENADFELYAEFFSAFEDEELLSDPNFHNVSKWLEDSSLVELARSSLELGQANMARLKSLCDAHDVMLTVSVHPWPEQILKGDTTNMYVESWRRFAMENGIGFINLFPVFINETNAVITANQCYIQGDNHWNAEGHRRVADQLTDRIRKRRNP